MSRNCLVAQIPKSCAGAGSASCVRWSVYDVYVDESGGFDRPTRAVASDPPHMQAQAGQSSCRQAK